MNRSPDRIRPRRSAILTALVGAFLAAALGAVLGGCAVAGRAQDPAAAPGESVTAEPSYREHDGSKKLERNEPRTIAAWEARIQRQGATLYTLVHGVGGAQSPPPAPPPSDPPSTGPQPTTPSPGSGPYRRPSARRYPTRATRRATAGSSGGTSAKARQSIRCRRICRTVRAICYAARRICQIASRVGGQYAQAACKRNQKTCRSARTLSARQGCATCGYAKRRRTHKSRRVCLR